jgi:hypothetical protein
MNWPVFRQTLESEPWVLDWTSGFAGLQSVRV